MHQSLILFFKNLPEFHQLDLTDQMLLVKCNLVDVIHLHHIVVQNFQEVPQIGALMSRWVGADFHQSMSRTRARFDCFVNCPLVIKLTMIVLIFSVNLSIPRGTDRYVEYRDKQQIYRHQNFFVALLWKYLNHVLDEKQAIRSVQLIVTQILRYQTLMNTMGDIISRQVEEDSLNPLMQSVLQMT